MIGTCAVCGRVVETVEGLSKALPVLCELHGTDWNAATSGPSEAGDPPPDWAYDLSRRLDPPKPDVI